MKKQDVGDPQHINKVLQSIKSPATLESWKLFSSPFINAVMMLHAPGVPKSQFWYDTVHIQLAQVEFEFDIDPQTNNQIVAKITSITAKNVKGKVPESLKRAVSQKFIGKTTDEGVKGLKSS